MGYIPRDIKRTVDAIIDDRLETRYGAIDLCEHYVIAALVETLEIARGNKARPGGKVKYDAKSALRAIELLGRYKGLKLFVDSTEVRSVASHSDILDALEVDDLSQIEAPKIDYQVPENKYGPLE